MIVEGVLPFKIGEVAVALHFVERAVEDPKEKKDPVFDSMELDLLSYQFQQTDRPIKTTVHVKDATLSRTVHIEFPDPVKFESEGRPEEISIKRNPIEAKLQLSKSYFKKSKLRVWHCVITPVKDFPFDEYIIIALIHLYDGRAESSNISKKTKFRLDNGKLIGTKELINVLRGVNEGSSDDEQKGRIEFLSGTIQLSVEKLKEGAEQATDEEIPEISLLTNLMKVWKARTDVALSAEISKWAELYKDSRENQKEGTQHFDNEQLKQIRYWGELLAFGGIVVGIFDFKEVDFEELLDSLVATFGDEKIFIQMNRCTLVAWTPDDRVIYDKNIKDNIGISPYLLFPHAAIIHNETLVSIANSYLGYIDEWILGGCPKKSTDITKPKEADIRSLQDAELRFEWASRDLKEWQLPNVFNYVTEQTIFYEGTRVRGSLAKQGAVEARRLDTRQRIDLLWKIRSEWGQIYVAAIMASIAGMGLVMTYRDWLEQQNWLQVIHANVPSLAIVLAAFLGGVVIFLRRRGIRKSKTNRTQP